MKHTIEIAHITFTVWLTEYGEFVSVNDVPAKCLKGDFLSLIRAFLPKKLNETITTI